MRECCSTNESVAMCDDPGAVLLVTVGNPNVGKTTLVNALSGSRLRIGNWPGTTVEQVETCFKYNDQSIHLVDLPGAYGLAGSTAEEKLTCAELLSRDPRTVIDVVDAGNLERNLALTIELTELGKPVLMAFNLVDEAEAKGMKPNVKEVSRLLDMDVIATVAVREEGVNKLVDSALKAKVSSFKVQYHPAIEEAVEDLSTIIQRSTKRWLALAALTGENIEQHSFDQPNVAEDDQRLLKLRERLDFYKNKFAQEGIDPFLEIADARYRAARDIASKGQPVRAGVHRLTQSIDKWVLHKFLGIPVFLLGMLFLFRFTFVFSGPWVDWLGTVKDVLVGWIAGFNLPTWLNSLLLDGVLEGVGTILSFLPVLFLLYFALSFMEASGFLARSSFLVDRVMRLIGLPGKAFIPMLVGFGCNVPGISATKTLESFEERLRVSLSVPFAPCSARLTVFTFFAALFFPHHASLVMFFLCGLGVLMGLFTLLVIGRVMDSDDTGSIMELPPYRIPTFKILWAQASSRTMSFLEGAGGAILIAVVVVWVLLNYPPGVPQEHSSYAKIAGVLTYCMEPLGISDWRMVGALVPGFVAKEVVIGTLAVSYLGSDPVSSISFVEGLQTIFTSFLSAIWETVCAVPSLFGLPQFGEALVDPPMGLGANIIKSMSGPGALAYLVFVLLYTPCIATLTALRVEFGWRWAAFSACYHLVVAWVVAYLVFISVNLIL